MSKIKLLFSVIFIIIDLGNRAEGINRYYGNSLDFKLLIHNELNIENIKYYLDFYKIKNKEIALKQIILETGNLKSNVCIKKNNLFGLYNGKRYLNFAHWSESIKCYKKIEEKNNNNKNYYKFLKDYGYSTDKNYIKKLKKININK